MTGGGPTSSATSITFLSTLSDSANAAPNEITVYLNSSGALMMSTYAPVTTNPPSWTFASTPSSTVTLLAHAALATGQSAIFSYYGYDATTDALITTISASPTLSQTNAAAVAKVGIEFQAEPSDGSNAKDAGVDEADTVTLRLSAATNTPSVQTTPTPCA